MRSLRSLHENPACGPQNFGHLLQNDFCNTIPSTADIGVRGSHFRLCEGFRMPAHDDGATRTGAGVRKPPREETAGGVAKLRVRRYGDFVAGGVLPTCVDHLFWKRSKGWRARSADRDRQNRRHAAEIDRQGGCPGRRDGEHGRGRSRAGETEVQYWHVAANLV